MNYDKDNKIWRVLCPLFAFWGIRFLLEAICYAVLWYIEFKEINLSAAFNGITYVEEYGKKVESYSLLMTGIALIISIPVMYLMMKKDYEYPINPRRKEKEFKLKKYINNISYKGMNYPIILGITASLGIGRFISLLPIDGILGSYKAVMKNTLDNSILLQLVVLGVLTPVLEELLFRGIIYKRLKTYCDVTIAAYIAAIIFGIAHFNLIQGLYAFVLGIVLTYLYEKSGSLVTAISMHCAANMATVFMNVNPISRFIDKYLLVRIVVAVIMIVVFVKFLLDAYEKYSKEE